MLCNWDFIKICKKGVDILVHVCYDKPVSKSGTARPPEYITSGGDNMTVMEVLALLNLLAVVIFGVITVTKKK